MNRLIAILTSLALIACTPAPADNSSTFTLSSGIVVASNVATEGVPSDAYLEFETNPKFVAVKMRQYFYGQGEIKQAWLSLPRNGIATLNIGTGAAGGLFATKDELLMEVTVKIQRDRLPVGTTLSVYNLDTAETIANYSVR